MSKTINNKAVSFEKSIRAYKKALTLMPGGVNSPVRSFSHVGGTPIFAQKAKGPYLFDVDGNRYTDFCLSWGVAIAGHAHAEVKKAAIQAVKNGSSFGLATENESIFAEKIIAAIPSVEKVRLVNSGTEAVMSAIRLARAYTGRNLIVKFDGCYHGHADHLLVAAGSGLAGANVSASPGITSETTQNTISIPFNNFDILSRVFAKHGPQIAAVITEPVPANMGVVIPLPGFLEKLRHITRQYGALLIFDEVITGFRFCYGGVQNIENIQPDITTLGKIIGGGFPIGAYGARSEIMNWVAPAGPVYQAGTLSGNPVAVSAGIKTFEILSQPGFYDKLNAKAQKFFSEINSGLPETVQLQSYFNMFSLFFSPNKVQQFEQVKTANHMVFAAMYHQLLKPGVYLSPSGYEANFVSASHTVPQLKKCAQIIIETINTSLNG